ncbi:BTAD domain-containing putative transcriptional regulator [Ramlibacter albus]|uniref:Bacterial transcriptional activator domain-containing protein n=1 Tax=Ramlibacter albus TaxID=2079448 RepID=A0A923M5H6_9BURK|nr:BTAD domain-containing putative transcriptional regulator [Ramlibacter albus]MBC5763750.1 hypothetical protein [Ramlibacter albus]
MPYPRLQLLGAFVLETPQGAVRLGRKAQAMLACCAMHATGVSRARLVALLWADLGEEEARNALRQCLHLLRRGLGSGADLLDSEGDRIVLRAGAWDVDVHRFEFLAQQRETAALVEAAELVRGDFLEALDAGEDFNRWAAAERERLRDAAHALLTRMCEVAGDAPTREAAVRLGRRLLANDPLHEGCYRALMQVHARAGLRAKALQLWNECRDVLRKELGVEPSPETAAVVAHLSEEAPAIGAATRRKDDPRVQDLILRGLQLFKLTTAEDNLRARAAFETAANLAPDHAEAIARLAWTYWLEAVSGWSEDAELSYEYAANAAARAVTCDWRVAAAHTAHGKVLLWRGQHEAALEQMRLAVALAPSDGFTIFNAADTASWSGRYDEALQTVDRALAVEPNDAGIFLTIRGFIQWITRDYRGAQASLESAATRNPTYVWPHGLLAMLHAECGELELARSYGATAQRLNRRISIDFAERVLPFKDPAVRRRCVEAYRAAGVPEHERPGGLAMGPPHWAALPI